MQEKERSQKAQQRLEEDELANEAKERNKELALEADLAEQESNRVRKETIKRIKAKALERAAALEEERKHHATKTEAQKRKNKQDETELLQRRQRAEEERQKWEKRMLDLGH